MARSHASTGSIIPAGRKSREASNSNKRDQSRRVEPRHAARPSFSARELRRARHSCRWRRAAGRTSSRTRRAAPCRPGHADGRQCSRQRFPRHRAARHRRRQMLVLLHRDPSLTIPLCVSSDARRDRRPPGRSGARSFSLPQLQDEAREPAPRRRRRNAIRVRRPKFLMRRRVGALLNPANLYRGEREIIARN